MDEKISDSSWFADCKKTTMADLDDFFAKKDRKKSKGKKFLTTEEIAKKLEETGKKIDKPKKDKPSIQPPNSGQDGTELGSGNIPVILTICFFNRAFKTIFVTLILFFI